MDLVKHKLIDERVLNTRITEKTRSENWCGVYVYGDDRDFVAEQHAAPIHAFKAFSKYDYPVYLFINGARTGDVDTLLHKYSNINVVYIEPLRNSFEYNYWFINKLWYLIDHPYCLTFQNDGYLLRSGYEDFVESHDFDYIGAAWKDDVKLQTKYFNLPAQRIGNGGMSARKPEKMREVLSIVNSSGGQEYIVEGQFNNGEMRLRNYLCAEDSFFCNFGFGLNIFKPVSIEDANKFSLEPIPFDIIDKEECPWAFHRCDF